MTGAYGENDGSGAWLMCQRTRSTLTQLKGVLEEAVGTSDPQLRKMTLHLIARGGKRLRPALLLLAAGFGDFDDQCCLKAAAAMEFIHVASLYHDDIMDRAPARRGGASANLRWGNTLAALTGTYLFARASALLAPLGDIANHLASQAAVDLCTGQLKEIENAYNLELTEAEYLDILTRKTATLFELPCQLGAYLGGVSLSYADAFAVYGRHLGLAFQLADDALDLAGQAGRLGKATGTDLREGIYGLPVLRALQQDGMVAERLQALLAQARLTEEDVSEALRLVRESGAVADALEVARERARQAQAALGVLPDSLARLSLSHLAEYAIARSF
jgi:geranylgeranyl pyrophosphate synthase